MKFTENTQSSTHDIVILMGLKYNQPKFSYGTYGNFHGSKMIKDQKDGAFAQQMHKWAKFSWGIHDKACKSAKK